MIEAPVLDELATSSLFTQMKREWECVKVEVALKKSSSDFQTRFWSRITVHWLENIANPQEETTVMLLSLSIPENLC